MKKMILAGAVLVLSAQLVQAQISIAPEVGMHLSNLSVTDDNSPFQLNLKNKAGLRAGVNVNIQLGSGLFLQPGLFYTMRGARYSESTGGYSDKVSFNFNYLEIPLNLGYQYSLGKSGALFATAGPYMGYGLVANSKETISFQGQSHTEKTDAEFGDDIKRIDIGMNFGLGYKLPVGVYLRAQYSLGLTNLNADGESGNIKNNGFVFTVGYEFMLKHKAKVAAAK